MTANDISEASSSSTPACNTCEHRDLAAFRQEISKGKKAERRAKKVQKKTLQQFYEETADYFRPPEVKTFVS